MNDNILRIKNLKKTYHDIKGEIPAIEDINIDVSNKEFIAIVGPSGCGKSTLLKILAGLEKESSGSILFNGKKKIGFMLQTDSLFPWKTVLENSLIGLEIENKKNKKSIKKVHDLLEKYGLNEFKNKYPSSLSGGMRQRVALIRTLATNPDILLLDEPYSALDYQTRLKVGDDVFKIIKEENKTVVIVTHDIAEAISMCNKIIVFSKRPATIKNIHEINLSNKSTPINNREAKEFKDYYKLIWKEIDNNE